MPARADPRLETRLHPVSEQQVHPSLPVWSRAGRYLLAVATGAAAWVAATAERFSSPLTEAQQEVVGTMLFLDLVVGALTLALLPLRRRYPLAVACLTATVSAFSVASIGPAAVALISMATWRRRAWIVAVALVFLSSRILSDILYRPLFWPTEGGAFMTAGGLVLSAAFFAATVAIGYYVAARRELVSSLRERALTAERERALTTQAAREAERTRIAREMHDVMAHRISLVAMHAGALAYRDDLTRAETAETAETIRTNARLALVELRQVLGVLRPAGGGGGDVEAPQPTLAELPALLADAREAGSTVTLDIAGLPRAGDGGPALLGLPATLSRTSFRIAQEALTNARKHAADEPVVVRLAGASGAHLELEVVNRVGARRGAVLPSAGVGLAGLAERAELAGGWIEHGRQPDGTFVVRARLPWPE